MCKILVVNTVGWRGLWKARTSALFIFALGRGRGEQHGL